MTTHLIRRGTFTITYPEDNAARQSSEPKKETFGAGDRIDVPAGKLHEVWIGQEGCEYVIGEWRIQGCDEIKLWNRLGVLIGVNGSLGSCNF